MTVNQASKPKAVKSDALAASETDRIADYQILGAVHRSTNTNIFRARNVKSGQLVVLKVPQEGRLGRAAAARYKNEFEIIRAIQSPRVVSCLALERAAQALILVLEDAGGDSLRHRIAAGPLSLKQVLAYGAQIAEALNDVHAAHVIHKDINPDNIIVNDNTDELKLIDFGSATMLSREQQSMANPGVLEGTLAYISPEQTGRMNRAIDYRSDFYSFGVTLYELLTGVLPFTADDPLDLVHLHVAKQPPTPNEVNPAVPAVVSQIVMKLMSKTAENRYQSARGIKADLDECLRQLDSGATVEAFTLARHDQPTYFQIPQKLYGREDELRLLLDKFDRVAAGGRETVFIPGAPGIGKTALMRELYQPIAERGGYVISAEFDEFQCNTPYKALTAALRELVKQLLTQNEQQLAYWRERLLQALGPNGQLVIDAIPDVELIIGAQLPVPQLGAAESQNRANLVFRDFIQAFCHADHPLALFLDGLGWIDSASLQFLVQLLKDESIRYLLIVGSYRSNEVDSKHPLLIGLQRLKKAGVAVDALELQPLKLEYVNQLLAEALRCEPSATSVLAQLLLAKTGGNPFFIEEFLTSLYAEGLLTFDVRQGTWTWGIEKIQAQQITDNVVDLMTVKLDRLDLQTRHVLALAACLGNQFDIATLASIFRQSAEKTIETLRQAVLAGFIVPVGASSNWLTSGGSLEAGDAEKIECRFSHDHIQQAAYGAIPEIEKPAIHKAIGQLLLARAHPAGAIFDIVNHLNHGAELITDEAEQKALVELTLKAARIAKYAGSYDSAFELLKAAISRLPEDSWRREPKLTMRLHAQAADAALLCASYAEMEALCQAALAQAENTLEKVAIYETRIAAELKQGRTSACLTLGAEALKWMGVNLPAEPGPLHVMWSLWKLKLALFGKNDDDLVSMKGATPDARFLAIQRLLNKMSSAAYATDSNLFAIIVFESLRLSVKRRVNISANSYAAYGIILCGSLGDIEKGYRYGELALRLVNELDMKAEKAITYNVVYAFTRHWKRPMREVLPGLVEGYQYGVDFGDFEYAAGNALSYCYVSFHSGKELAGLAEEFSKYGEIIRRKLQQVRTFNIHALYHQATLNLLGKNADPCSLSGEAGDEMELLKNFEATKQRTTLHTCYFLKQYLAYLFGHYDDALQYSNMARHFVGSVVGTSTVPVSVFYDALVRLAVYPTASRALQREILRDVERSQKKLKHWAQHAPENYRHKSLLVAAELECIRGNELKAIDLYERAITLAREQEFTQEEALANELAAKFHMARERKSVALTYLRQALQCYEQWGATAKVEALARTYPQLAVLKQSATMSASITTGLSSASFDLRSLTKALRGITEEKTHSQLIQKTIVTAMEFAGADNGLLILRKTTDNLFVEAAVSTDDKKPKILQSIPLADAANMSHAVVNYVKRTRRSVVINDALDPQNTVPGLRQDPYIKANRIKSVLCIPLMTEGTAQDGGLIGLLYLENNQASNAFDEQRIGTLEIICLAAAGRLELSRKAMTDGLTELYNHDSFQNLLKKEFSTAARAQRQLSVIMVDIDHFKKFNDQWGHQVGDTVLRHVASKIKDATRQSDIVARYGGEEMAVILPDTDQASVLTVAERIRSAIEAAAVPHEGTALKVTASLGVATLSAATKDPAALVKAADEALYKSKEKGRNRVSVG